MPPRKRTPAPAAPEPAEFYEWDALVTESHVDAKPYRLRISDEEFLTIPCPSGAAYIQLNAAQQRRDVAGILINLTTSGDTDEENQALWARLMELMGKADFPVVDKLTSQVLAHYFNAPPKAADGSDGGPGESSAS